MAKKNETDSPIKDNTEAVLNNIKASDFELDEVSFELICRGYRRYFVSRLIPLSFREIIPFDFNIITKNLRFKFYSEEDRQLFEKFCVSKSKITDSILASIAQYYKSEFLNAAKRLRSKFWKYHVSIRKFEYNSENNTYEFNCSLKDSFNNYLRVEFSSEKMLKMLYANDWWKTLHEDYRTYVVDIIKACIPNYAVKELTLDEVFPKLKDFNCAISIRAYDLSYYPPISQVSIMFQYSKRGFQILDARSEAYELSSELYISKYSNYIVDFSNGRDNIQSILKGLVGDNNDIINHFVNAYRFAFPNDNIFNHFVSNDSISPLFFIENPKDIPWHWLRQKSIDNPSLEVYYFDDKNNVLSDRFNNFVYPFSCYCTIEPYFNHLLFTLYAFNNSKSVYYFSVNANQKITALFFIWAYYSSNLNNKRRDNRLKPIFDHIGIISLNKGFPMILTDKGFMPFCSHSRGS